MKRLARAFTIPELLVSVLISSMAVLMVFKLMSLMQSYWFIGTVNLNQLQEARLAINYLRRDFAAACPRFSPQDPIKIMKELRRDPIRFDMGAVQGQNSAPIQVSKDGLTFFRYTFETVDGKSGTPVEQISYNFDKNSRILTRTTSSNVLVRFKGIQDVQFKVYVTRANPAVPLLSVKLTVFDEENAAKVKNATSLDISTTVSSSFMAGCLNHPSWNFTTLQE